MTPIVFLPGMMCDARLFGPQIAALSANRTLHFPPLSGHDNFETLAMEILANAPPQFALAGLSMGGIVAMEIIRQAPNRVERIALMDTNPKAEANEVKAAREPQMVKAMAGDLVSVMRNEMKPNYLTDGPRRNQILDLCLDMALGLGKEVFVRQSKALQRRCDQRDTLRTVRVPALVLCGEDDIPCPLDCHELIHDLIPGSVLEVIKGAGHLPTLEQPDATTYALTRWLEEDNG